MADCAGQVLDLLLGHCDGPVFAALPDGLEHVHEVVVVYDRHAQVRVVVLPLRSCSLNRLAPVEFQTQEALQNLQLGQSALNEVLVEGHVDNRREIFDGYNTIAARVYSFEGKVNDLLPAEAQRLSQSTDKSRLVNLAAV